MTLDDVRGEDAIPAVLADQDGLLTWVNGPFESVFGWSGGDIVGQPLSVIIPPDLRAAHHLGFSRFLMSGTPTLLNQPLRLKAVTKEGTVFEAEHVIVAERRDGRWVFGATIRPLDER